MKNVRCNIITRLIALALAASACMLPAHAQGYPNKPVRIYVGYSPGGSADAAVRPLARVLETLLGQPMLLSQRLWIASVMT